MRDEGILARTARHEARQFSQGGEHYVELDAGGLRVIKHTKELGFGFTPDVDKEGHIILRPATANEYDDRVAAHERLFPTGLMFERVNGENAITVSQPYFVGVEPELSDVQKFLFDAGFKKVSGANIYDRTLEHTTYFNPKNGHVIGDAKPANFKKLADKCIVPIDLMITHAGVGSALRNAMSEGIK